MSDSVNPWTGGHLKSESKTKTEGNLHAWKEIVDEKAGGTARRAYTNDTCIRRWFRETCWCSHDCNTYTRSSHATVRSKSKFLETSSSHGDAQQRSQSIKLYPPSGCTQKKNGEKWTKMENVQYAGWIHRVSFCTILDKLVQVRKIIISVRFLVSIQRCIYHAASSVMDRDFFFLFCISFFYIFMA